MLVLTYIHVLTDVFLVPHYFTLCLQPSIIFVCSAVEIIYNNFNFNVALFFVSFETQLWF